MVEAVPTDELISWLKKKKKTSYPKNEEEEVAKELLEELECLIDDSKFDAFDADNPPIPPGNEGYY